MTSSNGRASRPSARRISPTSCSSEEETEESHDLHRADACPRRARVHDPLPQTRGNVRLETGRSEQALADFLEAGRITGMLGIENPAYAPWRSQAALRLHQLDRQSEARELASTELKLSRRWGAAPTTGISLRALGLVEGGHDGELLLREVAISSHPPSAAGARASAGRSWRCPASRQPPQGGASAASRRSRPCP